MREEDRAKGRKQELYLLKWQSSPVVLAKWGTDGNRRWASWKETRETDVNDISEQQHQDIQ